MNDYEGLSRLDRLIQLFNADRRQSPLAALSLADAMDPLRVQSIAPAWQNMNPEAFLRLLQLSNAIQSETTAPDDSTTQLITALLSQIGSSATGVRARR